MKHKIKAILFDSGRVLNGPTTGHWFITPNFFEHINQEKFYAIPDKDLDNAFALAADYITKQNLILTEAEEFEHFHIYYNILFQNLPQLNVVNDAIYKVTQDLVYNYNKYAFYLDVMEVLPKLQMEYKLAVVSDAWPSLEGVFASAGIRDVFSAFIISSKLGISKPDSGMYTTALEQLQIYPEEAVFIDDRQKNCDGAKALGIKTILLCRELKEYLRSKITCKEHLVIKDLNTLPKLLKEL